LLGGTNGWLFTASSKEYSELVKISREDFRAFLQHIQRWRRYMGVGCRESKGAGYSKKNINQSEFISTLLTKDWLKEQYFGY